MRGLETVSWEHLEKVFVVFKLEKRRLGSGVGRRDTVAVLGSLRGAEERPSPRFVEALVLVLGPRVECHHDGAATLGGKSEERSYLPWSVGVEMDSGEVDT